ncbi:hypothetical protein [Tautonia plasticadhaerens]|uniref:Uncharacterized protein n=1 Tax=Tautonia plasticadhaerens TaxID=2527974 RepID=A0A518H477_9BACT|nr:hypothetical protein [Tautonia plasticadhaerens]QDV35655.1 hypothetical protein ElP_35590 [Tautonia plasticadhaerens]
MDEPDLDEPIPVDEATRTVVEALLFTSNVGALHAVVRAEADGADALMVTLAREFNGIQGAPRRFRIAVQSLGDRP